MQPLKDFIVLDFLEWYKRHKREPIFVDRIDYDADYKNEVIGYASEYVRTIKNSNKDKIFDAVPCVPYSHSDRINKAENILKTMLKSFIDSPYFSETIGDMSYLYDSHHIPEEVAERFIKNINNMARYDSKLLKSKLLSNYWKLHEKDKEDFNAAYLVDSVSAYYRYEYSSFIGKEFCVSEINIIEDFFEFLLSKEKKINLNTIPRHFLLDLVKKYCGYNREKEEVIMDALKDNYKEKLFIALKRRISSDKLNHYKDLGYLTERYTDNIVKFKCLILPVKGETFLNRFINLYWDDLDSSSGNDLDIFVSKKDIEISGYQSMKKVKDLELIDTYELPCIVMWKENLYEAKCVNISGIGFGQIYRVLQRIISDIKKHSNLDEIIQSANETVHECREYSKSQLIIRQEINTNLGTVIGTQSVNSEFCIIDDEINTAIDGIKKLDTSAILKNRAIGLLINVRKSIKAQNTFDERKYKEQFIEYVINSKQDDSSALLNYLKGFSSICIMLNLESK